MPELTVTLIVLLALATMIGAVVGWILRSNRSVQEKAAVNASWQERIDARHKEHERLGEQNKGLMEQVSQLQASHNDAKNRARELSLAVQEAFARRDELQREIKDIRSNLEVAVNERKQLQSNIEAQSAEQSLMQAKDDRIDKLTVELENWQNRLPPLIERFRTRNEEANQLEAELATARARIQELEEALVVDREGQTRIEPVQNPEELTDGLDASNDPADDFMDEPEPEPEAEAEALEEPEAEAEAQPGDDPWEEPEPETDVDTFDRRDDLKEIKGVGPAIEKTLNEMGIVSFRQIADMSEYDIDRVAKRLKGFHSRIYRENWIGQARDLLDQAAQA